MTGERKRVWDPYLADWEREVSETSGLGQRQGFGRRPALLVIDVTYNFCGDRPEPLLESIKRWRNSCGLAAWEAVTHIRTLIDACRELSVPVLYSAGLDSSANVVMSGRWRGKNSRRDEDADARHANGRDIVDAIRPLPHEIVVRKSKPSVFFGSPLGSYLVEMGVDTLVVCGGSTSGCVRATVLDAFSTNYRVVVAEDACFDRFAVSHAITLFDLDQKYADVVDTGEVVRELRNVTAAMEAT